MGYVISLVLTAILVAVLLTSFAKVSGRRARKGRTSSRPPLSVEKPSADAPTPGASIISAGRAAAARRHTRPA